MQRGENEVPFFLSSSAKSSKYLISLFLNIGGGGGKSCWEEAKVGYGPKKEGKGKCRHGGGGEVGHDLEKPLGKAKSCLFPFISSRGGFFSNGRKTFL